MLDAAQHRFSKYTDSAIYIKYVFDTAASLCMLASLLAFIGELVDLPFPITIKMGRGTVTATKAGVARINMPRSDDSADGCWSCFVFALYVQFEDPTLCLLSAKYLNLLGFGDISFGKTNKYNKHLVTYANDTTRTLWWQGARSINDERGSQ